MERKKIKYIIDVTLQAQTHLANEFILFYIFFFFSLPETQRSTMLLLLKDIRKQSIINKHTHNLVCRLHTIFRMIVYDYLGCSKYRCLLKNKQFRLVLKLVSLEPYQKRKIIFYFTWILFWYFLTDIFWGRLSSLERSCEVSLLLSYTAVCRSAKRSAFTSPRQVRLEPRRNHTSQ